MRSRVAIFLLASGAAIAANPLPSRAAQASRHEAKGQRAVHLLRQGHLDEAAALLREALADAPKSAVLTTDLAYTEQLRGHPGEAERLFRHAIELEPSRWYAYANLAAMKASGPLDIREHDALVALLEKGLTLQKSNQKVARSGLLLSLVELERAAGNLKEAQARLAEANQVPKTASQSRHAAALLQALELAEAKRGEERAQQAWPEPAIEKGLLLQLAVAEGELERDPAATLREATRLSALHRTWRGPRWLRARALLLLEQLEAATCELEALLRLEPTHAAAWRLLGETLAAHGGPFEAERADLALRHALALEPSWIELWEVRGRLLFRSGRADEARRALERAESELTASGAPIPDELAALIAAVRSKLEGSPKDQLAKTTEPTPTARALFYEAEELLDGGDELNANERLARALADSPALIDAAALRWSLTGVAPDETARALANDPRGLLQLVVAIRARALTMSLGAGEPPLEPNGSEIADAGASPVIDAGLAAAAGAPRAFFEPAAVAALVGPWLSRAADLGDRAALLERARLRADGEENAAALEDLGAAVAAGLTPDQLEEAQGLRDELLESQSTAEAASPTPSLRPEEVLAAPGSSCAKGADVSRLIATGAAHELLGELSAALACYAAAPEDRVALTRLSRAAARAPIDQLSPISASLAHAQSLGISSASLALARWLASQGRTEEALAAVDQFLAAKGEPGFVEPGTAEGQKMRATLAQAKTQAHATRMAREMVGIAITSLFGLGVFFAFFRGQTISLALARHPSLFPAVARAVAELRHDALKHRASAISMVDSAPREEILRALSGPQPASQLIAETYAQLATAAESRGVRLRRLRREPVFGPLYIDLRNAEEQLGKAPGPGDARIREVASRMHVHADRLGALLSLGPKTRLDAARLSEWIRVLEAELRAQGKTWSSPSLELQGLELDFPVAADALAAIFANLLRNAQAVAAKVAAPGPRVLVRVAEQRDLVGRRTLELRIGDASPEPLTVEQIEAREHGRGLSLVRELVREWQGNLKVHREEAPFTKSITATFPQQGR